MGRRRPRALWPTWADAGDVPSGQSAQSGGIRGVGVFQPRRQLGFYSFQFQHPRLFGLPEAGRRRRRRLSGAYLFFMLRCTRPCWTHCFSMSEQRAVVLFSAPRRCCSAAVSRSTSRLRASVKTNEQKKKNISSQRAAVDTKAHFFSSHFSSVPSADLIQRSCTRCGQNLSCHIGRFFFFFAPILTVKKFPR